MNPLATSLAELIALGVSGDALVAAINRIEQAMYVERAPERAERSRSPGAARQAKYMEKKRQQASANDARDVSDVKNDDGDGNDVSKRQQMTPLVRVRDITSNSVDRPNHTTLNRADGRAASDDLEWPPVEPVDRRYLDRLEGLLRSTGGKGLNQAAPNLMIVAPILALGRAGNGPACDLYADILPVIAARGGKASPGSIKAWDYFTEPIREARDRRLAGAPASQEIRHERPDAQTAKFDRKQRNLAVAGSVSPAQRRAFIG